MKALHEPTLNAADAFGLVSKYRAFIILTSSLCAMLFVSASYTLPKRYKSHFAISIYAKYFQNPLIRDFIPELSDPAEMKSQRQSLIRQSLTPEFLDALNEKYGISRPKTRPNLWPLWMMDIFSSPLREGEQVALSREELLTHIQVLDMNNTTFHVSYTSSDPEVTLLVTRDIYAQVIKTLQETHMNNLVNIRDAIRKRLESLTFNMTSSPDPRASLRPQIVKEELADIRSQILALSTQFTEDHPVIKELRDREKILTRWQGSTPESGTSSSSSQGDSLVGVESQDAVKDIYNDLMKKLSYLNIALEADRAHQGDYVATFETPMYPQSPLWPKKGLMALWGLALGFVGSLSIASLREYFDRTTLRTRALADQLGLPLLGELPPMLW